MSRIILILVIGMLSAVTGMLLLERKRARQANQLLEANKRFMQRITETLPSVLFVYDLEERRNIFVSNQYAVLGYTEEEFMRMGDQFLVLTMHPDDLARIPALNAEYLQRKDGEVFEHLFRFKHK